MSITYTYTCDGCGDVQTNKTDRPEGWKDVIAKTGSPYTISSNDITIVFSLCYLCLRLPAKEKVVKGFLSRYKK